MRISAISISNSQPIERFELDAISDVVVIAGPNGVGKSRLIQHVLTHLQKLIVDPTTAITIEATCDEERTAWGKSTVSTSNSSDTQLLKRTLQKNRHRHNLLSSILNFESDRSIQNVQPFAFNWELPDPNEEVVAWGSTFGFMRERFNETLHGMFKLIEHQRRGIANRAITLQQNGLSSMDLDFDDPMAPFKDVFWQLLSPKVLLDPSLRDQTLEYRVGDRRLPFSTLSSGEREVVNICFDFLLRHPKDCVVFFDEPELHLHPELSQRLIRVLQTIGASNQFIFTTHSPELITSSLDHTVVFIAPPSRNEDGSQSPNQAVRVVESDTTNAALRSLGHSIGIVALGKRIVLIEGQNSSLDKQTYSALLQGRFPNIVLVPSEGKHVISSFAVFNENILSRTIWGIDFFMLCDGDVGAGHVVDQNRRLFFLPRYHLENYFLDETVWADVFAEMEPTGSWLRSPERIGAKLKAIARSMISYSCAVRIASQVRAVAGNVDVMSKGCQGKNVDELIALLEIQIGSEHNRIRSALDVDDVRERIREMYSQTEASVDGTDDLWRRVMPGRPILHQFLNFANLSLGRGKALFLKRAAGGSCGTFDEVVHIFEQIARP